jgi:hypothetical protein
MNEQPQHWVWVARPDYYLDDDDADRRDLERGGGYQPGAWWTCDKDTRDGDLVLLYRSRLRQDIAYRIQARSDAYELNDADAIREGWDYRCPFNV